MPTSDRDLDAAEEALLRQALDHAGETTIRLVNAALDDIQNGRLAEADEMLRGVLDLWTGWCAPSVRLSKC